MERLGLGDAAVRSVNAAIVYCSTSGYGQTGPRSQWAGHDLNYLAVGGTSTVRAARRRRDRHCRARRSATPRVAGCKLVIAILAALVQRSATGVVLTSTSRWPTVSSR